MCGFALASLESLGVVYRTVVELAVGADASPLQPRVDAVLVVPVGTEEKLKLVPLFEWHKTDDTLFFVSVALIVVRRVVEVDDGDPGYCHDREPLLAQLLALVKHVVSIVVLVPLRDRITV